MRIGSRGVVLGAAVLAGVWLVGIALVASDNDSLSGSPKSGVTATNRHTGVSTASLASIFSGGPLAQTAAPAAGAAKPQMSDEVFKNIQVLKGIPVDDFMGTMGIMSASLGYCCADCHTGAGTDTVKWEEDNPKKRTARKMVTMVQTINKDNFNGRQVVTCWSCHRGRDRPVVTPTLDYVYSSPVTEDDDILTQARGVPTVDQVFDKYLQALGGAQKLATVTSFIAKGPSGGYGGYGGGAQVEVYAKAPDMRATYLHFADPERGDSVRTFNGHVGWVKTPLSVLGEYSVSGAELDGAKLDAELSFPAQIKQALTNWRVSGPTTIDDKKVQVVQGNGPRGLVATLYFDDQTGLLTRVVRFGPSPIGRVPTQVDYSEYRDVNGIKWPLQVLFTWLDGKDALELRDIQVNVPIDPAKFGKPPATVTADKASGR